METMLAGMKELRHYMTRYDHYCGLRSTGRNNQTGRSATRGTQADGGELMKLITLRDLRRTKKTRFLRVATYDRLGDEVNIALTQHRSERPRNPH
jgi:hypothetical protein